MDEATDDTAVLTKLRASRSTLASLLDASEAMERGLAGTGDRIAAGLATLSVASDAVGPLHSQAIATKALHARINRAVSPALALLQELSLAESLQRRLARLSAAPAPGKQGRRLARLGRYVECVGRLQAVVGEVAEGCGPAVQRLQEAVEFLGRTKATDQLRTERLRETMGAIRALYEAEVEAMRYEGALDAALLRLQDEYEAVLQGIRHKRLDAGETNAEAAAAEAAEGSDEFVMGSDAEVEVLRRISETLAANDCLDICIDIYIKVRYRRAAKALMRLSPDYLKTYAPEDIDAMEWESLESAVALWILHFELAVRAVFVAEQQLCRRVLSSLMEGAVWPECLAKVADKIMAVFFRFAEGVARSAKEPQKLFKLLDMFDAMDRLRPDLHRVFDGEPAGGIRARFRELQKLLVHAATKVFWEFGLQIEGGEETAAAAAAAAPPGDGAVPKIVRYAVNYLKYLASEGYGLAMGRVLRTEQQWKSGVLSRPEPEESLLRDAVSSVLDALQRNIEAKRARYKDRVLPHVFAMNSYWYIYMRIKGSELAKIIGEDTIKKQYKTVAEEAAYLYQSHAWGPLVELLARDDVTATTTMLEQGGKEATDAIARSKIEAFMKGFDDNLRKHRSFYSIPDADLREQIKEAVAKLVVPTYADFLHANSSLLQGRPFLPPDSIAGLLMQLFGGGSGGNSGVSGDGWRKAVAVEMQREGGKRPSEYRSRFRNRRWSDGGRDGRLA